MGDSIDFVSKIYQNTQNMIILADSKASTVLTIQSFLISITIGATIVVDIFQKINKIGADVAFGFCILLSIFIICSLLGIGFSIFVFKARGCLDEIENNQKGLIYFGHVASFKNYSEYLDQITHLSDEKILEEYGNQIFRISCIAKEKMIFVNYAVTCLLFNVFFTIVILLITGYVNANSI